MLYRGTFTSFISIRISCGGGKIASCCAYQSCNNAIPPWKVSSSTDEQAWGLAMATSHSRFGNMRRFSLGIPQAANLECTTRSATAQFRRASNSIMTTCRNLKQRTIQDFFDAMVSRVNGVMHSSKRTCVS